MYFDSQIGIWYTVWWQNKNNFENNNHWDEWSRSKPSRGYYGSDDKAIITEHLSLFKKHGIDFIIIDDTNNHYADNGQIDKNITAIFDVANILGNQSPKIAIALGGSLWMDCENCLESRKNEADTIYEKFVRKYPDVYYKWHGKPLLVSYSSPQFWNWNDDRFCVRYATGNIHDGKLSGYKVPDTGLWGWVFNEQTEQGEIYGISPGFNKSFEVKRNNGNTYTDAWLHAIVSKKQAIVISSWNDFAEEIAVESATAKPDDLTEKQIEDFDKDGSSVYYQRHFRDISNIFDRHNKWTDYYGDECPRYYEELTLAYCALKNGFLEGYFYREEQGVTVYCFRDNKLIAQKKPPHGHPVVIVPNGCFNWFSKKV